LPPRRFIANAIAVAFALAFPFLDWQPVFGAVPAPSIMLQHTTASALAAVAFGINKRPLKFFGLRRICLRDIGAALLAFVSVFALVGLVSPVVQRLSHSAPADTAGDSLREDPIWFALVTAMTAGVFEEFIYRGFIIEELGELIRNRQVAAVISIVFFAFAHHLTVGWSLELIYPGLFGAVITALYLKRRNLPVCMALHAALDSLHALTR
jgi:membrane protease YdiL (CAAX protease family)